MSESSVGSSRPAPTLGADTRAVLSELGLDAVEIADLEQAGIAVQWQPQANEGGG